MSGRYDDIINTPYPTPSKRLKMSMIDRAAQFSPFAALTGYDAAIEETGRLTQRRIELDEEAKYMLDLKQQLLLKCAAEQPEVTITYFVPDSRKAGGSYVTANGSLKKIDTHEKLYILADGSRIKMDDVVEIDSTLFNNIT